MLMYPSMKSRLSDGVVSAGSGPRESDTFDVDAPPVRTSIVRDGVVPEDVGPEDSDVGTAGDVGDVAGAGATAEGACAADMGEGLVAVVVVRGRPEEISGEGSNLACTFREPSDVVRSVLPIGCPSSSNPASLR